ncbi:MAG: DoxX family protein, partial [Ilumatobacteraceae bacterium]
MKTFDLALLVVRVFFGFSLAAHGYNKFFGKGGLTGTTG